MKLTTVEDVVLIYIHHEAPDTTDVWNLLFWWDHYENSLRGCPRSELEQLPLPQLPRKTPGPRWRSIRPSEAQRAQERPYRPRPRKAT